MITITVVIPVYNAEKYIVRAVESVLAQSYKKTEIIIIDDGSYDGTKKELLPYINSKIVNYFYQKNKGAAAARNHGISKAQGEYIAFLDQDDEWLPNKLEKQIKLLEENVEAGLATCGIVMIEPDEKKQIKLPQIFPVRQKMIEALTLKNVVGGCSVAVVRKKCFNTVGYFDETLNVCDDWDLWFRISEKFLIVTVNEPLIKYYVLPDSLSSSGDENLKNELIFIEKMFNRPIMQNKQSLKNKSLSYRYFKAAISYRNNGKGRKMEESFIKSFQLCPTNVFKPEILKFYIKNILFKKS